MRATSRFGFLALVVAHQQLAGAVGDIGHVGAPLVEDQGWPARDRSQRLGSAATRELRLLISRTMVAAERVSWGSRIQSCEAMEVKAR